MKKILNATKDGACQTITAHYHKEGWSNLIGGGKTMISYSLMLTTATGIVSAQEQSSLE